MTIIGDQALPTTAACPPARPRAASPGGRTASASRSTSTGPATADPVPAVGADHPLPPVEGPGPLPQPPPPRDHLRRSRQRPVRSADRRGLLRHRPHPRRHRGRARRHDDGAGRPGRALRRQRLAGDPVRRGEPDPVLGIVAFAVGVPLLSAAPPVARPVLVRGRSSANDELGADQPARLATRLRGVRPVLLRRAGDRAALDEAGRGPVGWALDGSPEAMIADADVDLGLDRAAVEAICAAVRCPMLIVHGTEDVCQPPSRPAASPSSPGPGSSSSRAPAT